MTKNVYFQRVTAPTAFITKGRQRVKQYDNKIFLRSGDEFEFELFNPKSEKVLAKIKLNGKYISDSGIVLRPGERVFLERYLDEARKFQFETYEVEESNPNVQEAIKNNGDVEVEFYDEYKQPVISPWTITYTSSPNWEQYKGTAQPFTYTSGNTGCKGMTDFSGSMTIENASSSVMFCSTTDTAKLDAIETGIVEKGEHSNQSFNADYSSFNSYWSHRVVWKILPESRKPIVKEDLKIFCTNCGAKRKKSAHKFCPNCGAKF